MSKVRVQFDVSPRQSSDLDQLVMDLNASTRAEVLRKAIGAMKVLAEESEGGTVKVQKKDGTTCLLIL